jgi:diacylglycerol kinase family enzyme
MISIMNGTQFGYNVKCMANANPSDGLLDVLIIRKFPKIMVPLMALHAITNTMPSSWFSKVYKAKKIEIKSKDNVMIQLDGEPIKAKKEVEISINAASIKMIVTK